MKKIIVITGASSGMGKDFALQLANEYKDAELWLIARRVEKLETLSKEIETLGAKAKAISLDLSGRKGASEFQKLLANENEKEAFTISLLVNNAGFGTYGPFAETEIDRELDMIDLNCTSLVALCSYAIPFMEKGSAIINTASLASFLPLGNFAVYGATKSFVLSFSIAIAAELKGRGIHVCALCPGPVSTEFADVASNGVRKEVKHGLPSDKVVAHCLKKVKQKKHIAIMAFKWKFKAFASRFVGRYAGAWFTYVFCKRPYKKGDE